MCVFVMVGIGVGGQGRCSFVVVFGGRVGVRWQVTGYIRVLDGGGVRVGGQVTCYISIGSG